jgi:general secretion pathway protein L
MLWPTAQAVHWVHDSGGHAWLGSASAEGVRCLPLAAIGHDRTSAEDADAQWLADPAVAAQAEQALDRRLAPVPLHDWLLRVAQSDWNLAQFDLSLSSGARRGQRLRQGLRQFRTASAWRPARWGLAALLVAQLLGLNAAAWHERSSLDAKRQAVRQTLQQTFPNVTLVLDAPVQMQRELAQLQQAGGQLSGRDLEAMLSALGSTGPGTTAQRLVYSPGELRLQAPEDQLRAQAQALAGGPWNAQIDGQALRLRPNTP